MVHIEAEFDVYLELGSSNMRGEEVCLDAASELFPDFVDQVVAR